MRLRARKRKTRFVVGHDLFCRSHVPGKSLHDALPNSLEHYFDLVIPQSALIRTKLKL